MPVGPSSPRIASALATALVALAPVARAEESPTREPWEEHRRFGIGWKVGNGLGARGADAIVAPWSRLAFELQVSYLRTKVEGSAWTDETASGWGVAPVVRAYLLPHGTTPFASVGGYVARWTYHSLSWTRTGLFATAGAEYRASSGFRFLFGAGIGYAPAVAASDGAVWIRSNRFLGPSLELGLRWMF